MGPRLRVSSERLEKPGIEHTTPGLEGEQLNHYAMEAYGYTCTYKIISATGCPELSNFVLTQSFYNWFNMRIIYF